VKQTLGCVADYLNDCELLKNELIQVLKKYGQKLDCNRQNNAVYAVELLMELQGKDGVELIKSLATIKSINNLQALAKSITSAGRVTQSIQDNNWGLLESVWVSAEGKKIKDLVCNALLTDELVTSLAPALKQAQEDATQIVTLRMPTPTPEPQKLEPGSSIIKRDHKTGVSKRIVL
jgi:hypothetical protein